MRQNARRALFRLALRFGKTESGKHYSRVADEALVSRLLLPRR